MTAAKQTLSICMFSNLFPPIVSGSSMFTWDLARHLVRHGQQVTVVTAQVDNAAQKEIVEGVQVVRLPAVRLPRLAIAHNFRWMTYTFTPWNFSFLKELFVRKQFDVVHQQNHVFDTILTSSRLARRYKLPLILTVHTYAQHPNLLFNSALFVLDSLARLVIVNKADVVVSPESNVKKYLETRHGISNSPIIPYGIEVAQPRQGDIRILKLRFGLGQGPIILSLGHVNLLRDRSDLIQAMPRVLQLFPTARLVIVGELYVKEPVQLVQKLGLENHITFTGALPYSQIPALFALSTVEAHTFNTTTYPGPGIASLEAMASGLPVITMEVDPNSSYIHFRNWQNVVMVPPNRPNIMAEALIRLLSDEQLRRRIGENARHMMSQHYSWDVICEAYISLYRNTIEQHQKREAGCI
jgi:1,2-diacylglycerol 3-alpha-glucosyltransferase